MIVGLTGQLAEFLRSVTDETEYASEETIAARLVEAGWVTVEPSSVISSNDDSPLPHS